MFLKSEIFKAISFKNQVKLPFSYWLLVGLRFLLTVLPQRGYIHPDEFFQNIEIVAGDILNVDVSRTWEFNPQFPIRNIFVPKMIIGPPLQFIRVANPYAKYYLNTDLKTPYFLLIIPRLFICLLSFINDYCLFKICLLYGQNFRNRLKIFASSYVILVYCCRSFSNAFEMLFFSILLFLVSKCMCISDRVIYHDEFIKEKYSKATTPVEKVKLFKLKLLLPEHSLNHVFLIATLVVVGVFNRPTFVGFAIPPIFFWLNRGLGSTVVSFKDFNYRFIVLMLCSIPAVILLILVDSFYYGYITLAEIESLKISWDNWVVTPLNFLRYNLNTKNLTQHGLHPRWLHVAVNLPLLFNVLVVFAFITICVNIYRFICGHYSKLPRIQSITGLMLLSIIIPVALLSLFPHQEARFIIPVLIPLVYLFGNQLYVNESDGPSVGKFKKFSLYTWYTLNVVLTLFYGFVHQGGIVPLASDLHREIQNNYGVNIHVVTTHSYSIPTFLLQLESTTKIWTNRKTGQKYMLERSTFLHKYGSIPMNKLFATIDDLITNSESIMKRYKKPYRFYLVSPCSLDVNLREEAKNYYYLSLYEEFSYYPHFCTEALPKFPSPHDQFCMEKIALSRKNESHALDLSLIQRISCYFQKFCLRIYRVKNTVTLK